MVISKPSVVGFSYSFDQNEEKHLKYRQIPVLNKQGVSWKLSKVLNEIWNIWSAIFGPEIESFGLYNSQNNKGEALEFSTKSPQYVDSNIFKFQRPGSSHLFTIITSVQTTTSTGYIYTHIQSTFLCLCQMYTCTKWVSINVTGKRNLVINQNTIW